MAGHDPGDRPSGPGQPARPAAGLVVEVLSGLQQRCAAERRTPHRLLRTICDDMRRQQVTTIVAAAVISSGFVHVI